MSTEIIVSLGGGFVLGLIASYLVWLLTARTYIPKVVVSQISRTVEGTRVRYRIAVRNFGSSSISDITVACRVVIQGLNHDKPHNWTSFHVPVADDRPFPVIDAHELRIYGMGVADLGGGGLQRLPETIAVRIASRQITLEELLGLGSAAFIRFAFSGSHEVGGLRRTVSPRYGLADIVPGRFVIIPPRFLFRRGRIEIRGDYASD